MGEQRNVFGAPDCQPMTAIHSCLVEMPQSLASRLVGTSESQGQDGYGTVPLSQLASFIYADDIKIMYETNLTRRDMVGSVSTRSVLMISVNPTSLSIRKLTCKDSSLHVSLARINYTHCFILY